jgi:hypothetical protein
MRASILAAVLIVALPGAVAAQTCEPSKDSHEADLFAHFSVPLAFSVSQGPRVARPGTVTLSLEGTYLPDVDDETATPTTCRPGKGPENVNLLFGFVRPRLAFALAHGTYLEVSWVPPITINDVEPNLWGFALGRTVPIGTSTLLTGRIHATIGSIHAPFVCSESSLTDPNEAECFGGEVSNDRYSPNIFGVELALGWNWGGGKLRPYLGGGYNILHPRFQVDHTDNTGFRDRQKVEVNLSRIALMGGATWNLSPAFSLSGEVYSQPKDVVTGRVILGYSIGKWAH